MLQKRAKAGKKTLKEIRIGLAIIEFEARNKCLLKMRNLDTLIEQSQ